MRPKQSAIGKYLRRNRQFAKKNGTYRRTAVRLYIPNLYTFTNCRITYEAIVIPNMAGMYEMVP